MSFAIQALCRFNKTNSELATWINNYIDSKLLEIITPFYFEFTGGLKMAVECAWVIIRTGAMMKQNMLVKGFDYVMWSYVVVL